jgi:hypothetical protein
MGFTGAVELIFIVAITGGIGGKVTTKRTWEQFDLYEQIGQAGLTFSISYKSLEAVKRNVIESMKDFLGRVATMIQELIDEEISSRMVGNEE